MPCRPNLRPAPIEQYLWISDEVVTEAWNRFLRVSSTHHHHHKTGRRYGSRVPGPLEAHRRLARRRIGVSAVGAGVQGGGAEFGALFGFGGYGGRQFDPQRDLKWKPPGVEKTKKEEHWMFPKSAKRKVDIFDTFLAQEEEVDAVDVSRDAFDGMLERPKLEGRDELVPEDLEDAFAFLQSTRDEPEANNLLRLCKWMAERPTSIAAFRALAQLITDKIRLRTLIEDDIPGIMVALVNFEKKSTTAIITILDAMPHEMVQEVACAVTRTLYMASPSNYTPSDQLLEWLMCLRNSKSFRSGTTTDTWRNVHEVLASCFMNPASLVGHLRRFTEPQLCGILLEHWVPRLQPRETVDPVISREPSAKVYQFATQKSDIGAIRATYAASRSFNSLNRRGVQDRLCTIDLLDALRQHNVPQTQIAMAAYSILSRGHGVPTLFSGFRQLQTHPDVGVPQHLPARLIRHLLESKSRVAVAYAARIFLSCPWVPLSSCPDLPIRLVEVGKVGATALWTMLRRQTPEDHVLRKDRTHRTDRLRPDHAHLVHQVALEIANCPQTTPRVAYRRVWECYRFLNDRGAHVQPTMTSAIVTAGIMRYLQEHKRPASAQVRYILHIVEKVEGKQVAMKLDRVIWTLWKEDVLPKVKARWREHVARVRMGVQEIVEEISARGRRFDAGPKWAKKKKKNRKTPRGTKDQRIAAARQDWAISSSSSSSPMTTIQQSLKTTSTATPALTSDSCDGDASFLALLAETETESHPPEQQAAQSETGALPSSATISYKSPSRSAPSSGDTIFRRIGGLGYDRPRTDAPVVESKSSSGSE
ncbi:hypothetical protein Slin15195_G127720 [Septoria linicola]|uniref:Uncharacterized protein n=1 Tax=Septoria linicola TaxID=215465 RepID=A0A9Q9B5P8_9PEZI|nr:hypothetical protein Slin15195_G127720 [Septoria linicola]